MDIRFKRMSDETQDNYIWRICENRKTYDLDWENVGQILNKELNENFTSSKWRKNFQNEKRGYDRAIEEGLSSKEIIEELKVEKLELEMARKNVQTEKIFANRILREHGREKMLKEMVADAIAKADKIPLPEFTELQISKDSKSEFLLSIADAHVYKAFKSITNEYSKKIYEDRMSYLKDYVIKFVQDEKLDFITIVNLGDNLEGVLRSSALSMLELGVADTIVEYRRYMAKWLSDLSKHVKIKYIHLISSNHTEHRPLNSRAGQFPKEDFEKDIAWYIHDLLEENKRIEVIVPDDVFYHLELAGQDILCHHGHGISNVKKYFDSMCRKLKVWFTSLYVGHLHSESIKTFYEDVDGGDVELIRAPSIVGSCEFADKISEGSKAAVLITRHTVGKGRDREYKIILN